MKQYYIMKHTARFCLLLLVVTAPYMRILAQNRETTIKIQAMEMAHATLDKNLDKFLTFMHPKVVEFAGGKEKIRAMMDTLNKGMAQFGAEIKNITIGHPYKTVEYSGTLQSTLPQTTTLKWMSGKVTLETTLVAWSEDGGKHWYFMDTNVFGADKLKSILPTLSPDLVIPPRKPPKIEASEE